MSAFDLRQWAAPNPPLSSPERMRRALLLVLPLESPLSAFSEWLLSGTPPHTLRDFHTALEVFIDKLA